MNWFERHLNWTAVFITSGSFVLCFILVIICTGGYDILLFMSYHQGLFIYFLALVVTGCLALSAIGYKWILRRKNRSLGFLFFYAPPFIFILTSLFKPFPFTTGIPVLFITYGQLVIIIGWIILLSLKNHHQDLPSDNIFTTIKSFSAKNLFGLWTLFRTVYPFKLIVFSIILLFIISGISFLYMNFGYTTYKWLESPGRGIPEFSFEYPPYFRESIDDVYIEGEILYLIKEDEFFNDELTLIRIDRFPSSRFGDLHEGNYKQMLITELFNHIVMVSYEEPIKNNTKIIPRNVDGIPGYFTTLTVEPSEDFHFWGTGSIVFSSLKNISG